MSPSFEKIYNSLNRDISRRISIALICSSLLIYTWPILQGPFLMDEVYGVISTWGVDIRDSTFSVLMHPFSDGMLHYFLTKQGRVAPFGVLLYHGGYWLTSSLAFATGISIAHVYSLFKISFLCISFFGLRQLLIEFIEKDRERDSKIRSHVTNLTLLSAFVFVSGLRTDFADRNGLMVYPFLTYTALVYAIWLPLILLRIRRSTHGAVVFPVASVIFGCIIGFGYELHYCAVVTTTIALFLTRKNKKILSKSTLRDSILIITFGITYLFNQILISKACANADCYSGTKIQLGQDLPRALFHNLIGNLPLKANSTFELYAKAGMNFGVPSTPSVHYWSLSLVVALLIIGLLFRRTLLNLSHWTPAKTDYRSIPAKGFVVFAGLGGFIVLATSLSQMAQDILTNSVPFRGYVVAWFSISVACTLLIFAVSKRVNLSIIVSVLSGLILGCYLHAWSIFGVDVAKNMPGNIVFQKVIIDFQNEPGEGNDNLKRCHDLKMLGDNRRAQAVRINIDSVYSYVYGEKFCSSN